MSEADGRSGRQGRRRRLRHDYGLLLLAILVSYLIGVLNRESAVGLSLLILVQLSTIWLALRVSQAPRLTRVAGFLLVALAVLLLVSVVFGETAGRLETINEWWFALATLLYLVAPIAIVRHLVRRRVIDFDSVLGVICAYLMIGLAFAFLYRLLGQWQPGPFFGAGGDGTLADDLFFSFITLATVGYGNLVPAGNPGQTLAVVESIAGQLFLVVVVAKVVSSFSGVGQRADDEADRE